MRSTRIGAEALNRVRHRPCSRPLSGSGRSPAHSRRRRPLATTRPEVDRARHDLQRAVRSSQGVAGEDMGRGRCARPAEPLRQRARRPRLSPRACRRSTSPRTTHGDPPPAPRRRPARPRRAVTGRRASAPSDTLEVRGGNASPRVARSRRSPRAKPRGISPRLEQDLLRRAAARPSRGYQRGFRRGHDRAP
jgi:hypothetical protein